METRFILLLGSQGDTVVGFECDCSKCDKKDCPTPGMTSFIEELKKYMIVEEDHAIILPPKRVSDLKELNEALPELMKDFSLIALVDLEKEKAFLYKGPDPDRIKKIYLPKFFKMLSIAFKSKDEVCLEGIEDLRDLYQIEKFYNVRKN